MEKFIKKYVIRDEKYLKRGFHRYRDWYGDVVYVKEVCDGAKSFGWIVCNKDGKAIPFTKRLRNFKTPKQAANEFFVYKFQKRTREERGNLADFVKYWKQKKK